MGVVSAAVGVPARGVSAWRELLTLIRLALFQRVDPHLLPGREATIALLGAGLLALWVFIEPLLRERDLAISWYALPHLVVIAAATCALAWLLWRLSRPAIEYRRVLLVTIAALPVAIVGALASQKLVGAWLYLLIAGLSAYALAYFSLALRTLTGRFQNLAVGAGAIAVGGFVLGADHVRLNPSLWVRADERLHALDGATAEWARMAQVQFGQQARIDADLGKLAAQVPGVPETFFVGFAGYGEQQVFAREIDLAARVVAEAFGSGGRSLQLVNDQRDVERWPLASEPALGHALQRLGRMMGGEDVLFLALSSHGERDAALKVTNAGVAPAKLRAEALKRMLGESGIAWRVVVVSACYSGSFVDALADERTIVIAAAAADRKSFGCNDKRHLTNFGEAFFRDALPGAESLRAAFEAARATITRREEREQIVPSLPRAHFGAALEKKLGSL